MEFQVKSVLVLIATIVAFAIIGGSSLKQDEWPQKAKSVLLNITFANSLPGYFIE